MEPIVQTCESYSEVRQIESFVRTVLDKKWSQMGWHQNEPDSERFVVIKPNWISDSRADDMESWEQIITHPALVMTTVQVLAAQMGARGTIALCDAPESGSDFSSILQRGGLQDQIVNIRKEMPRLHLEVLDLRKQKFIVEDGVVCSRRSSASDPRGYALLDLGRNSMLYSYIGEGHYYGADYDRQEVNRHHRGGVHEYPIARTPLLCDLFINLPKLKTHKKTGMTCALKNLVGINGDKNWLPHHTESSLCFRGDEFATSSYKTILEHFFKRLGIRMALEIPWMGPQILRVMRRSGLRVFGRSQEVIRAGNWHGNDTCWRMVHDLNRALLYGNPDGTWRKPSEAKNCLIIVDGIVSGEGNGPLEADAVRSRVLFAGDNAAEVDAVACKLMGFNPNLIPLVREAFAPHSLPLCSQRMADVTVSDGRVGKKIPLEEVAPATPKGFRPHFGWKDILSRRDIGFDERFMTKQ